MDLKRIRQIIELMNEHDLSLFHLEEKDFNIKLKKGGDLDAVRDVLARMQAAAAPAPAAQPGEGSATSPETPAENGKALTSPMVGTFYRRPSPEADVFADVGDTVSEGQTLCIIEAMKVMNEIKAESGGTVTEICVEDNSPVQFGDVLFRIR
ncbi:MAG: acetyl-CoA carboxylase biotin carboxyl carrier protein [Akkermansiaceae bacterium]|nr:acetyl-CoA carboxylase biotin carboxyl carrier protein [Akkermansiaceae bacterium]